MMRSSFSVGVLLGFLARTEKRGAGSVRAKSKVKPARTRVSTPMSLVIAPSMLVAENTVPPGVLAQFSLPLIPGTPLYFTADIGPYFRANYIGTSVAIAILIGMEYRFALPRTRVRPLFGVNLGPNLRTARRFRHALPTGRRYSHCARYRTKRGNVVRRHGIDLRVSYVVWRPLHPLK